MVEETQNAPLTAIELRQMEVDQYTQNIVVYQTILDSLNGEWDADLIHLKDLEGHEAAKACPVDRVERLSELQQYAQISNLIKTEMFERSKAQKILQALITLQNQ